MCEMTRTFYPVGQGAFYSEIFFEDKFTMIYDCGSYKNKEIIENKLANSNLKKVINLVVISHFHEDHINGLEYLLSNYQVERLLLPFLHNEEKIELFLHNSNDFAKKICLNPIDTVKNTSANKKIQIIQVDFEEDNKSEPVSIDDIPVKIPSGTKIKINCNEKNMDWLYIPFNFRFNERSQKLKELFLKEKIPLEIKSFIQSYEKNKHKIISFYREIKGDMNTNSLVLYSGPSKKHVEKSVGNNLFCLCLDNRVGCLYLGDFNAKGNQKWNQLKGVYEKYFECIGTIQVPHHGSTHNYNKELNFQKNLVSVISAGINNQFNHPDASTLKEIVLKKGIPIVITEKECTELIQELNYCSMYCI